MEHRRADSIEEFVDVLVRSGLAAERQTKMCITQFREGYLSSSSIRDCITAFRCFLVASGVLTAYQCWKLRNGQWKGFYLDDFALLDFLAKDREFSYYLARHAKDGTFVRLAVTPMARAKGPDFEYRIDHRFE
jgi:hypothetical protein